MNRKLCQVSEGRIACAKVIDGDLDTQFMQTADDPHSTDRVGHDCRFAELCLQHLRRYVPGLEQPIDSIDEMWVMEIPGREIDGHGYRRICIEPRPALLERRVD